MDHGYDRTFAKVLILRVKDFYPELFEKKPDEGDKSETEIEHEAEVKLEDMMLELITRVRAIALLKYRRGTPRLQGRFSRDVWISEAYRILWRTTLEYRLGIGSMSFDAYARFIVNLRIRQRMQRLAKCEELLNSDYIDDSEVDLDHNPALTCHNTNPEEAIIEKSEIDLLRRCIAKLTEKEKLLWLDYVDCEWIKTEVARRQKLPRTTVSDRIDKVIYKLIKCVEENS